jgi:hypothetical protein
VHRAQGVQIRSLRDVVGQHGQQVDVAPADVEAAGDKGAEQIKAEEPAAEMGLDFGGELGERSARILAGLRRLQARLR